LGFTSGHAITIFAIAGMLNHHYGPWTSQDADRLRAGSGPGPPT
jgi:hypothetical protein